MVSLFVCFVCPRLDRALVETFLPRIETMARQFLVSLRLKVPMEIVGARRSRGEAAHSLVQRSNVGGQPREPAFPSSKRCRRGAFAALQ
jgi:hypothetical protein